ncbi:NAD(P)/FAD-dependent oxidoreductase [Candidatus Bathyarchaeota archaeon]|nr:MAG: NAD(P)/FAD-dependent oxidoreductase [Candidatus Bathyarchaeota archaeon]
MRLVCSLTSDYDVIVAGAGVAGCMAAIEASKQGVRIGLFEEHPQVGVPSHCSGVVSLSGLKLLGMTSNQAFDQRLIRGARFFPPTGSPIEITRPEPVALIINRMKFDQYLAKNAINNGVELHTKSRITKFEKTSDQEIQVTIQNQGVVGAKVLIDASGAGSRLPTQAGLKPPDWSQILPGLQYELIGTDRQDDLVNLYFGSKRAPGFFAWSIPTGDHSVRAGLATSKGNVRTLLDQLVKEYWPKSKIDATKSGSVLVSGPVDRCWSPGFIFAGDAAGQVKQTTGGGIVIGGYCGMLAGKAAASAVKNPRRADQFLETYDHEWREKFSSDLKKMGIGRRLFFGLSDATLDKLFPALEPLLGEITDVADMDFQGTVITKLLANRKLASLIPRIAADNIRSLFS